MGLVVTRRSGDLQVGKPAPWAFHLEDRLSGAHFVDDIRESSVAAGAADLGLRERAHLTHLAVDPGSARPGSVWPRSMPTLKAAVTRKDSYSYVVVTH